jgi:toxin ParE1/3/4
MTCVTACGENTRTPEPVGALRDRPHIPRSRGRPREHRHAIAKDNPRRAVSVVDELIDRCESLADHPLRFPEVRSLSGRSLRELSHGCNVILYGVDGDAVDIVRVVHGARNWAEIVRDLD